MIEFFIESSSANIAVVNCHRTKWTSKTRGKNKLWPCKITNTRISLHSLPPLIRLVPERALETRNIKLHHHHEMSIYRFAVETAVPLCPAIAAATDQTCDWKAGRCIAPARKRTHRRTRWEADDMMMRGKRKRNNKTNRSRNNKQVANWTQMHHTQAAPDLISHLIIMSLSHLSLITSWSIIIIIIIIIIINTAIAV